MFGPVLAVISSFLPSSDGVLGKGSCEKAAVWKVAVDLLHDATSLEIEADIPRVCPYVATDGRAIFRQTWVST